MNNARAVLFDWDGTLLDSYPVGFEASLEVLRHFGIEADRKRFLETYSPNWYDSYERLGVPRSRWDEADKLWRSIYDSEPSPLFSFAAELLERLSQAGLQLGIVTSGQRERVERELEHHGLASHFHAIVCCEDTEEKKPHPAPLHLGLERLALRASDCVYVGDRPEDIEMGLATGTFTVAVESQYGPREVLEAAQPNMLLADASHLPEVLGLGSD